MEIKIQDVADGTDDLQLLGTQDAVFSCFAMAPGIQALSVLFKTIENLTGREKFIIGSCLSAAANVSNVSPLWEGLK